MTTDTGSFSSILSFGCQLPWEWLEVRTSLSLLDSLNMVRLWFSCEERTQGPCISSCLGYKGSPKPLVYYNALKGCTTPFHELSLQNTKPKVAPLKTNLFPISTLAGRCEGQGDDLAEGRQISRVSPTTGRTETWPGNTSGSSPSLFRINGCREKDGVVLPFYSWAHYGQGSGNEVHMRQAGPQHECDKARLILISYQADISDSLHFYSLMAMPLTNRLASKCCSSKGAAVGRFCSPPVKDVSSERDPRAGQVQLRMSSVYMCWRPSSMAFQGRRGSPVEWKCKTASQPWGQLISSQVSWISYPPPKSFSAVARDGCSLAFTHGIQEQDLWFIWLDLQDPATSELVGGYCLKHWERSGAQCPRSIHTPAPSGWPPMPSQPWHTIPKQRTARKPKGGTAIGSSQISDLSQSWKNHQDEGNGHFEDAPNPYSLQGISIFSFLLRSLGSYLSHRPQDNGGHLTHLLIFMEKSILVIHSCHLVS